jgi:hypothetical protein
LIVESKRDHVQTLRQCAASGQLYRTCVAASPMTIAPRTLRSGSLRVLNCRSVEAESVTWWSSAVAVPGDASGLVGFRTIVSLLVGPCLSQRK